MLVIGVATGFLRDFTVHFFKFTESLIFSLLTLVFAYSFGLKLQMLMCFLNITNSAMENNEYKLGIQVNHNDGVS